MAGLPPPPSIQRIPGYGHSHTHASRRTIESTSVSRWHAVGAHEGGSLWAPVWGGPGERVPAAQHNAPPPSPVHASSSPAHTGPAIVWGGVLSLQQHQRCALSGNAIKPIGGWLGNVRIAYATQPLITQTTCPTTLHNTPQPSTRIRVYAYAYTCPSARVNAGSGRFLGKGAFVPLPKYCLFASTTCRQCLQLAGRVYVWCTVSTD